MAGRVRAESGGVAPLVAVMLLGLLAVAALVVDGGVLFAARRDLQGLADGAARAGAMAVDEEWLRETEEVRLDPGEADSSARAYLGAAGFGGTASIDTDILSVTVHLSDARSTVWGSKTRISRLISVFGRVLPQPIPSATGRPTAWCSRSCTCSSAPC